MIFDWIPTRTTKARSPRWNPKESPAARARRLAGSVGECKLTSPYPAMWVQGMSGSLIVAQVGNRLAMLIGRRKRSFGTITICMNPHWRNGNDERRGLETGQPLGSGLEQPRSGRDHGAL